MVKTRATDEEWIDIINNIYVMEKKSLFKKSFFFKYGLNGLIILNQNTQTFPELPWSLNNPLEWTN